MDIRLMSPLSDSFGALAELHGGNMDVCGSRTTEEEDGRGKEEPLDITTLRS